LILGLSAALVAGTSAQAQISPVVTEADIERAQRETPTVTEQDVELARQKYALPSEAGHRSAPLNSPNLEALPQPATPVLVDLEALARGFAGQSDAMAQAQGLTTGPGLFIFVSMTMPRATLQGLVDQAARAKATIVIRGFANGSLRDTVTQVQGLIGQQQVAIQIDPLAFDRFAISKVPSFVLVRDGTRPVACASGVARPPTVSCGRPVTSAWITRWSTCSAPHLASAQPPIPS
jgi:conjugal transfer pilus assembly protein TrbC